MLLLQEKTLGFLSHFILDETNGGTFTAVDTLGKPIHCDDKQLEDQALTLLAITHASVAHIPIDITAYLTGLDQLKDKLHPGYTELADRYWFPHPSGLVRTLRSQLLTALALIEAGHQFESEQLLTAGLELFRVCFVTGQTKNFASIVSQDWEEVIDDRQSLNTIALFLLVAARIAKFRPDTAQTEILQTTIRQLYLFIDHQYGGLYEKLSPEGTPLLLEAKYLSSMSLAIIGLSHAYAITAEENLINLARSLADFIRDHFHDSVFQGYWNRCTRDGTVKVDNVAAYNSGTSPFPVKLAPDLAVFSIATAHLASVTNTLIYKQLAEDVLHELVEFRDRRQGGFFQGQGNWWSSPIDPTVPLTRHFGVAPHTPGAFQSGNTAYVPFQVKQAATQALSVLALTIGEKYGIRPNLPEDELAQRNITIQPPAIVSLKNVLPLEHKSNVNACDFKMDIKKYLSWLMATQVPGGAFGLTPYRSPLGFRADRSWQVFATVHVLADLALLGEVVPEVDAVTRALQSCQNIDGGFGEQPGHPSDVFTTYCGVLALHILGQTPERIEECIHYLQQCQNRDGGLGNYPGYRSDLWHTNLAVAALQALGTAPLDVDGCARFVHSCTNKDGAYSTRPEALPETFSVYRGVGTLYLLKKEIPCAEKTINWLQTCQAEEGGFFYRPGRVCSFVGTYHALAALYLLGKLPLHAPKCKEWLASHQNPDGGFSRPRGTPSATTDEGFISLHSAFMLDNNISRYWVAMIS